MPLPIRRRLRRGLQASLLAFAVCLAAPPGSAAQRSDPPARTLEPVVVTPTKTALPLNEAASSITVIDADEIRTRQTTEMIDLLSTVPGLHVSEQNSRGGLSFVEPRGGPFTFNQVLVDGMKLNTSGGLINWAGLSLANFDRVEVLRGPQSALYGLDAAGSVTQFFTTRGEGPFRGDVSVGTGNQSTFEELASFRGGQGPLGYSFGAHRVDTEGNLPINSDFRSTTLSGRLDLARAETVELTASFRFAESRHEVPVFVGGERFVPLDPHQAVEQEWLLLSGRAVHWIAPWWKHTLQLGYYRRDVNLLDPFDPGLDFRETVSENLERRYSVDYFWTVALPGIVGIETLLTAGVAYERETVDQKVVLGAPFPAQTIFTDGAREVRSAYLQAQLGWNRLVFLTPGFRVDDSTVFGTVVSPRVAAAVVIPQTRTKVRAAYGEGARAPSFPQLIGDGGIGFVTGNPNLRPERAESWEFGLDQSLAGGRAELGVTYFHTRFEDLISFVAGGSPSSQNVQAAEAQGVEFTARFQPVAGLTITGAYQYLRTKILDNGGVAVTESPRGARLPRQPTHGGSLTLDYVRDRLTASLTGIFVGEREDVNVLTAPPRRVTLAEYARVDTAISYVLLKDVGSLRTLGLFGKVRNLTDERYEDFFGFRAPGRTFLVGVRATF